MQRRADSVKRKRKKLDLFRVRLIYILLNIDLQSTGTNHYVEFFKPILFRNAQNSKEIF